MRERTTPQLSVVVCSVGADGAHDPRQTVDSIVDSARVDRVAVEVVVVWQAAEAAPTFDGASVVRVLPVGLSHARNRGWRATSAPIVAFVDDDELVDPGWAVAVLAAFARAPDAEAAFGPVAPLDDRGLPYCHYEGGEHRVFQRPSTPPWIVGTGGNMAFRREALERLDGFDLRFGAGSSGRSAEETDVILRLLRNRESIVWSPEMPVYHPTKSEAEHLASRVPYAFGMGSVLRRHRALGHVARYFRAIGDSLRLALRRRDARRRREALATLRGFVAGLASRPVARSPLQALERLPDELRPSLRRARLRPLRVAGRASPELRYRAGRRLLRVFPDGGETGIRGADGSVWFLEKRRLARRLPRAIPPVPVEATPGPAPDAAAATTGRSVLTGGVWKTAATALPQIYALAQSIVAARFLGPSRMGLQSLIAFSALSLTTLLSLGVSIALMRYIGETLGARRPETVRTLVRWGWRVEAVAALVGSGVLASVTLFHARPVDAWLLAAVAAGIGIIHTVPSAVLIGAQRWRDASLVGLVTGAVGTLAIAAVLAAGGGIVGMFAVEVVIAAVNMAWTTSLARGALRELSPVAPAEDAPLPRGVLRYALLMSYSSLLTFVVWRRSEVFFLQHYASHTEIAIYSIVFAAMTALVAVPQAIGSVLSPAVATLFGAGASDRIRSGFGRGLRLLLLLSLPLAAGALAVGPETLRLIYGAAYRGTGPVLLVMLIPLPFIPILNLARAFLSGLGNLVVPVLIGTAAAIANFALDFLLIPPYGAVGAAIANSTAQVIAGLPVFLYSLRVVGQVRWEVGALVRNAVASTATGLSALAAVELVGGIGGVLGGIVVGTIVFVVLAAALRVLPEEDARWLDDAVGSRLGGMMGRTVRLWAHLPAPGRSSA